MTVSVIRRFAIDFNPVHIDQINGDTEVVATRFNLASIKEYS